MTAVAKRIGAILGAVLWLASAPARADGQAGSVNRPSAGVRQWETLALVGPQVGDHLGVEASLVRYTLSGHVTGGGGGACGVTTGGAYCEAEGVLILTPHSDALAKLGEEYPLLAFTAGVGPALRFGDGAAGVQATFSATLLLLPVQIFVRPQKFRGQTGVVIESGLMLKLPVWGQP
jgi:hypothetical protein